MAARCVSPIKARVMRLVKLNECGVPVTGASSAVIVSKGFISVEVEPDYEEGEEFLQKNANGELCVNEKDPNELKRANLTVNMCEVDPDSLIVVTGERLLTTSPGATGTGVAFGEGQILTRFSLELWQPVAGSNACSASGVPLYVYWAFMNTGNARITDFTFENAPFEFGFQADTKGASTLWGTGPGTGTKWVNQAVEEKEHFLFNVTENAPPTPLCGAQLLT